MQSDFAHSHVPSYGTIEQQPLDEVESDGTQDYWRKRLLAFIQAMFVMLLILVAINFFTGLTAGHFSLVPFFPLMFLWIVLYVGHIGAHQRRTSFFHAYFILNVLIVCFVITTFILFPTVLGTIFCTLDGGYNSGCSWDETKAIAHITFIGILFAFIPCLPATMGAIYALRARNEILLAKMRTDIEEELGVTLDRGAADDRLSGLLHAAPVSAAPQHAPPQYQQRPPQQQQQQYFYQSYDYRPVVYAPNPPSFSSTTNTNNSNPGGSQQPLQFPGPAGYYYYPPPPPRSSGAPSAPAPSAPGLAPPASTPAAVPPSVPQQGGDDNKQ